MYGLSAHDIFGDEFNDSADSPDTDRGPDEPDPSAPAGVGLVIRAPRGPQPVTPTFSVYAVVEEPDADTGVPEVVAGQVIATGLDRSAAGAVLAHGHSLLPEMLAIPATAVICNDGSGRTLHRYPVLRLAG